MARYKYDKGILGYVRKRAHGQKVDDACAVRKRGKEDYLRTELDSWLRVSSATRALILATRDSIAVVARQPKPFTKSHMDHFVTHSPRHSYLHHRPFHRAKVGWRTHDLVHIALHSALPHAQLHSSGSVPIDRSEGREVSSRPRRN